MNIQAIIASIMAALGVFGGTVTSSAPAVNHIVHEILDDWFDWDWDDDDDDWDDDDWDDDDWDD